VILSIVLVPLAGLSDTDILDHTRFDGLAVSQETIQKLVAQDAKFADQDGVESMSG
jgi:hypothetical protein